MVPAVFCARDLTAVLCLLLASASLGVGGTFPVLLLLWVLVAARVRLGCLATVFPLLRLLLDGLLGRSGLLTIRPDLYHNGPGGRRSGPLEYSEARGPSVLDMVLSGSLRGLDVAELSERDYDSCQVFVFRAPPGGEWEFVVVVVDPNLFFC